METSCGLRVIRKSSSTSARTAAMLTAHSVGVPMELPAAAGSAAAANRLDCATVAGTAVKGMVVLRSVSGLRSPSPRPDRGPEAAPHRERHGTLVLTGAALGSTPLEVKRVREPARTATPTPCPLPADKRDSGATRGVQWRLRDGRPSSVDPSWFWSCTPVTGGPSRGTHGRRRRSAEVLVLRKEPEAGQEADRRPGR